MDVQDIVNTIANKVNIDPLTTEKVVGTILSVLEHEAQGTSAETLFDKLPGSLELAQKYDVMAAGCSVQLLRRWAACSVKRPALSSTGYRHCRPPGLPSRKSSRPAPR
jgi:hypothetical protein